MGVIAFGNQSQAAPLAVRGNDLYETPPQAVSSLLKLEKLPTTLWEPACGPGSIARVLREHGHVVYATDLVDYTSPDQDEVGWDFLLEFQLPIGVEAIITNPPFKNAQAFVEKALSLCPKVIMLLRLAFLESQRRSNILDSGYLSKVYVYRNRLPMMHRDGWEGPKLSSSGLPFAWFVWDCHRDTSLPTELHRISWE